MCVEAKQGSLLITDPTNERGLGILQLLRDVDIMNVINEACLDVVKELRKCQY